MLKRDAILPYLEYEKFCVTIFPSSKSSYLFVDLHILTKDELKLIYKIEKIPIDNLTKIDENKYLTFFLPKSEIKLPISDIKRLLELYLKS
ncbi:MAG: hypothetical protein QW040_03395 [Candidatus Aenigmatarchaeota archaeon]